jgi:hypothetical protein
VKIEPFINFKSSEGRKDLIEVKNMSVPHLGAWPLLSDTAGYQLDRDGK